ncbi:cysteine-rich protein 2-binding protein [Musca domestica]|uniref:Cysteine-rich protein 2-binding protein n=1 Tax=Musca domestica TaxID=7370 RepID=A0A1I8NH10_MUSDO|nr:cysteine-rich protein 2-binding protein [Musca domestica]
MTTLQCSYCSLNINDDDYLHCGECGGDVHVKCLRRSRPGDLMGDVFFDFTCAKCMQLHYEGPSTSSEVINGTHEKYVRQRMPWLMVITLTLYNLSIKSKGLSRHGYFHWRTHIVNFIDKNWDYLFDPTIKRRKKWTGSISGALSHNSPKYFTSGQTLFEETGWWKLTLDNKTPKYIFSIYEQQCLERQQIRNDKRQKEEDYGSDTSNNEQDSKRIKSADSEDELITKYTCSRMMPYMGRKPKVAKQLDVLDDDHLLNKINNPNNLLPLEDPSMPLNTVQSSLMDFLAESLASDDLNMFNSLPNIAPEPLVECAGKNDMMPLLEASTDNANFLESIPASVKTGSMDLNGHLYSDFNVQLLLNDKLNSFFTNTQFTQPETEATSNIYTENSEIGFGKNINAAGADMSLHHSPIQDSVNFQNTQIETSNFDTENTDSSSMVASLTYSETTEQKLEHHPLTQKQEENNDEEESDDDNEEFQPRIVQVTNFQQLMNDGSETKTGSHSPRKLGKIIKEEKEIRSDGELNDNSKIVDEKTQISDDDEEDNEDRCNDEDVQSLLKDCKPSLFTKQPRRQWPWLVERHTGDSDEEEKLTEDGSNESQQNNMDLTRMSEYEEKELLRKLRRIFSLEDKCKIRIPSFVRRFYRKLCIREWKRAHGKPLFNLDDFVNGRHLTKVQNDKTRHIDRYQLISLSSKDQKRSFHARIAGSFECEFFESPYTQRILHPYIFRNSKYFPPFLKLMCELQYKVNNKYPSRAPIDFCYVRPNHIAAVNSLLQTEFWPGIDMSECLSYPDYSVVALYKKLVIGCGFLVPDVGFNEAYISFMAVRPGWRRSGIGTFMLYHLIQTCMTKDITLHVSATNPAVVLYQKFGFKMEEVVLNFYDKYLPFESRDSRHALFLRLIR